MCSQEMGRVDYQSCKACGRHRDECGTISHERLCLDCGIKRMARNNIGISTKQGPAYVRQLVGIAKYAQSAIDSALVDPSAKGHTP